MQITADGHCLLGAPIGTQSFCKAFTERTVANWKLQLEALSTVARTQPQAAYAAFTHGFIGKWTFLRTTATGELCSPLVDMIRSTLIPLLIGRSSPGDSVRNLLAPPSRAGGLGLINPEKALAQELERSVKTCQPLTLIEQQQPLLGQECNQVRCHQPFCSLKPAAKSHQRGSSKSMNHPIATVATSHGHLLICSDEGAGALSLPMTSHGFSFPKAVIRDALCMRYTGQPDHLPSHAHPFPFYAVQSNNNIRRLDTFQGPGRAIQ